MMMQHDDDHDTTERMISNASAINRHRQHDQATVRSMAVAMRNVAAHIESIERAIALQAGEIERLDRMLVEVMRARPGAADPQIDQPVVEQRMTDAA